MTRRPEGEEVLGPLAADLSLAALALSRRFAAGATLWCWAPGAPHHAQHLAVEFVHPVVMGARALPAAALDVGGAGACAALRVQVRDGDVVAIVGRGEGVAAVLQRAPVWGAVTIWIGGGPRPEHGAADHVLWLDPDGAGVGATHDASLVMAFHLLWELSHVCFEHPGLLAPPAAGDGPACVTCADEGRLAEVVHATGNGATVRTPRGLEDVDVTLVGDVAPGDLVLVHAGSALTVVPGRS